MFPAEAAPLLFQELVKTAVHPSWTPREQLLALASLMERLFFEATKQEQLAFSTLFARICYVGHINQLQPDTLSRIHALRRTAARVRSGFIPENADVGAGIRAIAETILVLCKTAIPAEVIEQMERFGDLPWLQASDMWEYKSKARVVAVGDDPEQNCLIAIDEEHPERPVRVLYGLADRNENFNPSIQVIRKIFGFPLTMNLLEVDIDRKGQYRPRMFILEPDYLMDVSAISECFKDTGAEPYAHLVKKFLPHDTTDAILLGNIANYFLDRLLNEPAANWEQLFRETFQLAPFTYALMTDRNLRELSGKAQKHFIHLKNMAAPQGGLSKQGIEPENAILEPTFFSEQYGIQGRLDLFYHHGESAAIVELKSGTPFKPNSYGIQRSHFTQTLLYDLLVRSVFGKNIDPTKYILYSGMDVQQLRFAPTVAPEQWEALQLRNQLLGLEKLLANIRPGDEMPPLFARLRASAGKGFLQRDFGRFEMAFTQLDALERKYFNAFAGFIAREHWLTKSGQADQDSLNGHAALWRSSFEEKQQAFSILSHLEILENRANQPDPSILFRKTAHTNPLANFRVGDIAVLYPSNAPTDTVLDHQVIKCTITELNKEHVAVQLRFQQFNLKPFETDSLWNLEPDLMENGFATMYRSLLEWAEADKNTRSALLAPIENGQESRVKLLWGPPGTGKTSVMLRDMVAEILHNTDDNLLLLAYTNKAVDEICDAVESIPMPAESLPVRELYLRIGSRHATAQRYRDQLLNVQISAVKTRQELRDLLEKRRIFISTVASFAQNDKLLRLKKVQRIIVDEASQLLEPQLIGLLTRFEKIVLIGDHLQLPAVTIQKSETTKVDDPELLSIGLSDLRNSYFERMFKWYLQNGLKNDYSQLSHQGRMHADIMDFPNRQFYQGKLQTLALAPESNWQYAPLQYQLPGHQPGWDALFGQQRVVFLPVYESQVIPGQKTGAAEAKLAAELVVFFKKLFEHNQKAWIPEKTLGIITPWRAQIAQIRSCLNDAGQDPDELSIDTVERYQGGARDVIIVSCCVHSPAQLASLISLSVEGVDRKLNVALTRAREHLILLGNPDVLNQDPRYKDFISAYQFVVHSNHL
jgi:DNA replication ATP-dependent helicase Dna2